MKKKYILLSVIVFLLCSFFNVIQTQASIDIGNIKSLDYSGNMQSVEIVRSGTYNIKLYGAQGENYNSNAGGAGGYLEVALTLKRGDKLYLNVGGQNGYNGGGVGYKAGNGGGATYLYLNNTNNLVAIAGGGGGASTNTAGGVGGTGGGYATNQGANGSNAYSSSAGGGGGYIGGTASGYLTHVHSGSTAGGGCYTIPVYHVHTAECYRTVKNVTINKYAYFTGQGTGHACCASGYGQNYAIYGYETKTYDVATNSLLETREWETGSYSCGLCFDRKKAENTGTSTTQELLCTKTSSTIDSYTLSCGKNESTIEVNVKANGGTNYYNPSNAVLVNSLSGQKNGNGSASVTLTDSSFTINTQPMNASTFDGSNAIFTCYSLEASQTGTYVWQTYIDGSYKTIGSVTYKEKNSKKESIFYNTKYECGMDNNGVSYLNIKEATMSKNNETKYRCIVYEFENLNYNITSNEAVLTVLKSDISSMKASYISDVIEVNNQVKVEDVFAICGYQSGKSEVVRNFNGLKITSFETENNFTYQFNKGVTSFDAYKLGKMKVNLHYENDITNVNGVVEHKIYEMSIYINVIDTTPPVILNIDTTKDSYGNNYIPGNDFSLQVRAAIEAKDNYCETEVHDIGTNNNINTGEITYEFYRQDENNDWQKLTDSFRKGNYFDILFSYGNGIYKVIAKDENGNISEPKQFTVTAWDNKPPEIKIDIKEENIYSPYAEVTINATDGTVERHNIGKMHEKAYFLEKINGNSVLKTKPEDINEWTNQNKYNIKENGAYRIYVRDNYGNMSYKEINVQNVDTLSPIVSFMLTSCGDGEKVLVTIKAIDSNIENPNSAISGLKKTNGIYDCFKHSDNVSLSNLKEDGEYVRTYFYASVEADKNYIFNTYDNAGNCTSNSISKEEILKVIRDGSENEYSIIERFTCTNTDYTTKFPEWTSNGVIITAEVKSGSNLPAGAYSWDYINYYGSNNGYWDKNNGTWSSNPNFTVNENGTYTVCVKLNDGYINKKSIVISNIDNKKPIVSATQNNETLTVVVEDPESGIDKLIVDGGSLSNMYEFTYDGQNSVKEMVQLSQNGVYNIYAIDMAGNKSEIYSKTVSSIEEKVQNNYMVNFLTYTGAIISSQYVVEGSSAVPPTNIKRNGYTFVGWDKSFVNIQEDTDINAVFIKDENSKEESVKKHTVTFCNWDGAVIKSEAVEEGKSATPPSSPTKEGAVFTGWDSSYSNVHGDITTKALFITKVTGNEEPVAEATGDAVNNSSGSAGRSNTPDEIVEEEIENEGYIELTEFADQASSLSVSAFDSSGSEENEDEEFIKSILEEDIEDAEKTENNEIDAKKIGVKQVVAILVLVGCIGGTIFYFLNKKYYWINIPF